MRVRNVKSLSFRYVIIYIISLETITSTSYVVKIYVTHKNHQKLIQVIICRFVSNCMPCITSYHRNKAFKNMIFHRKTFLLPYVHYYLSN